jgi:DNA-binding transcriptional LysR family regulator
MQRHQSLGWDDLRYVLAIARARNLARAGRALGIDHSTVYRRLQAVERALAAQIFERLRGGYQATEAGERLIAAAERMEAEALGVDRDIAGRDAQLAGLVRVTSSETLAYRVLTGFIAGFRRTHPLVEVELVIDNQLLDLSRREADVALRARRPTEPTAFGRKVADIGWAAYGAKSYLEGKHSPRTKLHLSEHAIIGFGAGATQLRAAQWLRALPDSAIVYRSNSLINQLIAAKEGMGIALLPCYLADPERELVRVFGPIGDLATELWLITHQDLRGTARIRAFMDHVGEALVRQGAMFAGIRRRVAASSTRTSGA